MPMRHPVTVMLGLARTAARFGTDSCTMTFN